MKDVPFFHELPVCVGDSTERRKLMKRKKTIKQKLAELSYKRPGLERKMKTIEKSFQDVKKMLNENS